MQEANPNNVNPAAEKSEKEYHPTPVRRSEHAESWFTRLIEQQTAKIPSDLFLTASIVAIGTSLYYYLKGKRERSNLIGLWAPTLLTMGVYNKLVKMLKPR